MPVPALPPEQIQALKDALKTLDDVDAQIAAAEKAGLDVATRKALAQQHRQQITQLLQVYAPAAVPKSQRA